MNSTTELQYLLLTLIFKVQNKCGLETVSKFVSDAPEKLQLELIELQYDSILLRSFKWKVLITFYASLAASWFSELYKLTRNSTSAFGTTCAEC
jgi:hypothetical protein